MAAINRKVIRKRIHERVRKKIHGTSARPRLAVCFSNKRVYVQVIDDVAGRTIASASTMEKALLSTSANCATATKVGEAIAERALKANVVTVIFDRGGHQYHGKVKALADAARAKGLKF